MIRKIPDHLALTALIKKLNICNLFNRGLKILLIMKGTIGDVKMVICKESSRTSPGHKLALQVQTCLFTCVKIQHKEPVITHRQGWLGVVLHADLT